MILFEYVSKAGRAEMTDWRLSLENAQKNQLDQLLDRLEDADAELAEFLVDGTAVRHIFKLRVGRNVRLRPMLCFGPAQPAIHITLLCPATERDYRLVPEDAPETAQRMRAEILEDPRRSRVFARPLETRWDKEQQRQKKKAKHRKGRR